MLPELRQCVLLKINGFAIKPKGDVRKMVGNKGLARSKATEQRGETPERHIIRPPSLRCPKGRAKRRSLVFSLKKKNPDKPKGDVRNLVGNKGLEPLTPSM